MEVTLSSGSGSNFSIEPDTLESHCAELMWFTKWAREAADSQYIHMARFEEGLGRIMFVAGAPELERPFLGPLYKFMALHPRQSTRRVPAYVSFILQYLAGQVKTPRLLGDPGKHDRGAEGSTRRQVTRGLGSEDGSRDATAVDPLTIAISPLFSMEITEQEWQWIYEKESKAARIISTLEALAVLVALKLQFGETPGEGKNRVMIAPTITDKPGERISTQQTYDDEVPRVRSAHGTILLHEENEYLDGCRVVTEGGEQGGRQLGERCIRWLQFVDEDSGWCQQPQVGDPAASPGSWKSSGGALPGGQAERTATKQISETEEEESERAPEDDGSVVMCEKSWQYRVSIHFVLSACSLQDCCSSPSSIVLLSPSSPICSLVFSPPFLCFFYHGGTWPRAVPDVVPGFFVAVPGQVVPEDFSELHVQQFSSPDSLRSVIKSLSELISNKSSELSGHQMPSRRQ